MMQRSETVFIHSGVHFELSQLGIYKSTEIFYRRLRFPKSSLPGPNGSKDRGENRLKKLWPTRSSLEEKVFGKGRVCQEIRYLNYRSNTSHLSTVPFLYFLATVCRDGSFIAYQVTFETANEIESMGYMRYNLLGITSYFP